jgi:tetratricopeptide (TPR) repeat protein
MDCSGTDENGEPDDRVDSLVYAYFSRRRAGEELTTEAFIAEHPELAEKLRPLLEGMRILGGTGMAGETTGNWSETSTTDLALPTIGGYVLHGEIGQGGMGVVYKALQVATKRIVALKVLLAGSFASTAARRRFQREVELAARLQHPNIVRVLESGRVERQRYYAMDYVDGVPLNHYLSTAQPDRKTVLKVFVQICDAVEYAHGHGVIHRDLKPANVLIDNEGVPHILDFGLAKATDQTGQEATFVTRVSSAGQIMGTLPYISPEQAGGEPEEVDARTDVYALGVMLYEALTGSPPYDMTGRPSEIIRRILEEPPRPPSSFPQWRDGELDTILLKALEKEKDRRYQSARDLGEDLRRYLEGEPILARRPSRLYVLRKRVRKHPVIAVGVAAIVLAAAVAAPLAVLESRKQHRTLVTTLHGAVQQQVNVEGGAAEREIGRVQASAVQYPRERVFKLVLMQALYYSDQQEEATAALQTWLFENPDQWCCRLLLSEIFRAMGDDASADAVASRLPDPIPDTADDWFVRSFTTLDTTRATRYAEEAVARDPSHHLAWHRLANLYLLMGEADAALEAADRLIAFGESAPHWDARIWNVFKARVLVSEGRYEEAVELCTQRISQGDQGLLKFRAAAYRRLGDYQGAIADYTELIHTTPEHDRQAEWHYHQRATPLWIVGRTEEALEDCRAVRKGLGRPSFSDARQYLILRHEDRDQEAQQVLAAALRDVTENWLRQVFRCLDGRILPEELVDAARARESLESLCEACYYAGEVNLLEGRMDEACSYFRQCVETGLAFDPDTAIGTPMNEFELAQWRLRTLFADPSAGETEEN